MDENGEINWMYFLIDDDELLKKYNDIWNEISNRIKKESEKANPPTIKNFRKQNYHFTVKRLQTSTKKCLRQAVIILV